MAQYFLTLVGEDDSETTISAPGSKDEAIALGVMRLPDYMVVRLCWQTPEGLNLYRVIRADGSLGPERDNDDC